MDAQFFRNIRKKIILKEQQERAQVHESDIGKTAASSGGLPSAAGKVRTIKPVEEKWGMIPVPTRMLRGRVRLSPPNEAEDGFRVLNELEQHMDFFVNAAAESVNLTARVGNLEGDLQTALKRMSEVEVSCREGQEEVRRLRKANVHSAVKIGEASARLAEVRQTREKVFSSAQEQVEEANRLCEERIKKHEADTASKIKWLQEGLEFDRQQKAWLWDELNIARQRLKNLEPSAIRDTLHAVEAERGEYRERLELAERKLARKGKALAKYKKLAGQKGSNSEVESLQARLESKEWELRRIQAERDEVGPRNVDLQSKISTVEAKAAEAAKVAAVKLERVQSERDKVGLHNMDLLSKISVAEAKAAAAEKEAAAKIGAMFRTLRSTEEWVKILESDSVASRERAKAAEAKLEAGRMAAQIDPADAYREGFRDCREMAIRTCPSVTGLLMLPIDVSADNDYVIRKVKQDKVPFDLNE